MPPPTGRVRVNQVITDLVTRCHPGGFPLCGCCSYVTVDAMVIAAGARRAVAGDVTPILPGGR